MTDSKKTAFERLANTLTDSLTQNLDGLRVETICTRVHALLKQKARLTALSILLVCSLLGLLQSCCADTGLSARFCTTAAGRTDAK